MLTRDQMRTYIRGLASNSAQISDPKDRGYIISLNELLDLGLDDEIDGTAAPRIEAIYLKAVGRRQVFTMEHLRNRVMELAEAANIITNEDDREFVLGLQMLMDMDEQIDIAAAPRVETIYRKTLAGVDGV